MDGHALVDLTKAISAGNGAVASVVAVAIYGKQGLYIFIYFQYIYVSILKIYIYIVSSLAPANPAHLWGIMGLPCCI